MKTLSISIWLALAIMVMIVVALFSMGGFIAIVLLLKGPSSPALPNRGPSEHFVQQEMLNNVSHWNDPQWQHTMGAKFAAMGIDIVIQNASGHEVYRNSTTKAALLGNATQVIAITSGIHRQETAFIYEQATMGKAQKDERTTGISQMEMTLLLGVAVFLITLAGTAWFVGRIFLKPLSVITQAARQVAANDLDFHLPITRIREVAEVADAFKAMGDALRSSLYRQGELEQERRLFISAIVHDLRTPLFSLRGYLEGLEKGLANTPEKAAKYISVCQKKADALERLITDLFAYAQLEYLEQTPQCEPLEFGTLLQQAVEGLQPQVEAKGITLVLDGLPESCDLEGDAHLLTRAVENLLDNSLRHTPVGGTIRMSWYRESNHLVFIVTDTGPGIALQDLPHVFTPLYRSESSRNRQTGGAGLGLTIAQRILKAHGGDLTAVNAVGGGASFIGSLECKHSIHYS